MPTKKNCDLKNKLCLTKSSIYELKCTICGESYIGETQRCLHTRVKEHLRAIIHGNSNSAIAEHYTQKHSTIPMAPFTTSILDKGYDYVDRKIREAKYIDMKKPKINRDAGWDGLLK